MDSEIINLEKRYWNGMAVHDYETVKYLTRFPCIVAGKQGVMTVNESAYKRMFEQNAKRTLKVNGISEEQVQMGEDHAMIAYLIDLDYDGKTMKCACTSTWIKVDGSWLCAMHTESDLERKEE